MKYALLFETVRRDRENKANYLFVDPVDVIKVHDYGKVEEAFKKIASYSRDHYLAGYFSYELGYFFERPSFSARQKFSYPLIHLAVFKKPVPFGRKSGFLGPGKQPFNVHRPRFNYQEAEYIKKVRRIKEYIREGATYQVNFTGKYHFDFSGSAFSLYKELKKRQQVSYAAFCRMGDETIISLSPELFFRREGEKIYSRPMKGTIKRGKTLAEDKENILRLEKGYKDRAENLMIVDLMRNDLGRICRTGSVKTSRLFCIEKYNTLFQMTSTVRGVLKKDISYFDIFRNMFPGGSVTGAPKIRTMQIISELEKEKRDVYCGALGIIFPGKRAVFNMPIRTLSIVKNKGEMGVGSGIVIDSDPGQEFRECLLKARFLTEGHNDFQLIETMLWDKKFTFLNAHLRRMVNSAKYFGFIFSLPGLIAKLKGPEKGFKEGIKYRVRLLLDKGGGVRLEHSRIPAEPGEKARYIAVSKYRVDPENLFLYHKTTNRALYDSQYKLYAARGYFEVIFLNNRNELAEGAISNIIIQKNSRLYTPPVASGLLPGIFRGHLLNTGKVKEKKIGFGDLRKADKLFVCNSVRGMVEVKLKRV
jgi:para-aminobenzoate synthetase/4-amino-4-deoxychorismate lyase